MSTFWKELHLITISNSKWYIILIILWEKYNHILYTHIIKETHIIDIYFIHTYIKQLLYASTWGIYKHKTTYHQKINISNYTYFNWEDFFFFFFFFFVCVGGGVWGDGWGLTIPYQIYLDWTPSISHRSNLFAFLSTQTQLFDNGDWLNIIGLGYKLLSPKKKGCPLTHMERDCPIVDQKKKEIVQFRTINPSDQKKRTINPYAFAPNKTKKKLTRKRKKTKKREKEIIHPNKDMPPMFLYLLRALLN